MAKGSHATDNNGKQLRYCPNSIDHQLRRGDLGWVREGVGIFHSLVKCTAAADMDNTAAGKFILGAMTRVGRSKF